MEHPVAMFTRMRTNHSVGGKVCLICYSGMYLRIHRSV